MLCSKVCHSHRYCLLIAWVPHLYLWLVVLVLTINHNCLPLVRSLLLLILVGIFCGGFGWGTMGCGVWDGFCGNMIWAYWRASLINYGAIFNWFLIHEG